MYILITLLSIFNILLINISFLYYLFIYFLGNSKNELHEDLEILKIKNKN